MSLDHARRLQRKRLLTRAAFFALFVLAPPLDLFRLDLDLGHLVVFGHAWTLGADLLRAGHIGPGQAALNLVLRALLPIAVLVGLFFWVSWRFGRLYCGWLCPHFSVVELINRFMRRASGKPTLWEREPLPERQADGRTERPDRRYWALVIGAIALFAFLWALVLLTYLLPPRQVYANLAHGTLTRNQGLFLAAATTVFVIEFALARHLFCRFGCAVGLFQSYVWMFNNKALVVGFDHTRSQTCADCNAACDNACPMRLKPRSIKRRMFACTECARCIQACNEVQAANPEGPLLQWVRDACALDVSTRDFGRRYACDDPDCFLQHAPHKAPSASAAGPGASAADSATGPPGACYDCTVNQGIH